jgi:hypothetical protein
MQKHRGHAEHAGRAQAHCDPEQYAQQAALRRITRLIVRVRNPSSTIVGRGLHALRDFR